MNLITIGQSLLERLIGLRKRLNAKIAKGTALAVMSLSLLVYQPAQAGRTCEERPLTVAEISQGMELASKTLTALEASGAQVVLIARAGQDLSKYGLRYSHMGFAYRDQGTTWRVVHKLNQCGTRDAELFRQGLGEFFLDRPFRYEAAFLIPSLEIQTQLLALLKENRSIAIMHERRYNMLAYPWSTVYQQSNQWLIETLAGATAGVDSRVKAQAWLQLKDYQPTVLRIDALSRMGANITRANIAFDDHPNAKRFSGRIETVTADSVFEWMRRSGFSGALTSVR
jgi:hypothetical protein